MNLLINYSILIAIFKIEYYKNNRAIHKKNCLCIIIPVLKKVKTTQFSLSKYL